MILFKYIYLVTSGRVLRLFKVFNANAFKATMWPIQPILWDLNIKILLKIYFKNVLLTKSFKVFF